MRVLFFVLCFLARVFPVQAEGHDVLPGEDFLGKDVHIDPAYVQLSGVKTTEVTHHAFGQHIPAYGRIRPSTRLEYVLDMRHEGWIVDLVTDAVGDSVKKGDLLFTFFSPGLMTAQSDYLKGERTAGSEQRLRLFGMDAQSIAGLKKQKTFFEHTPFYAPADGFVTQLNVRRGSHVRAGERVLAVQNFAQIWVQAHVNGRDIAFLSVGTPATITIPETGETRESVIALVHPVRDRDSRTAMVRLRLENPDGALRPETLVDVLFHAGERMRLAVPEEAVLYGARGAYVIEARHKGHFVPVRVETGITANGLTEIRKGLAHGRRVVQSGQFLLDAEGSLKGGMAAMGHDHADMMGGASRKEGAGQKKGAGQQQGAGHVH